jgi:ribosomal protein L11 methyltransferase
MNKVKYEWLRVSLKVDPELAEAVADLLARYVESGTVIESTQVEDEPDNQGRVFGPLRVSAYIPADDEMDNVREQIERSLKALALIQPLPAAQFLPIEEKNWMESWKKHFQPLKVGKRIIIIPAWIAQDPKHRIPIRIDPGMAFGTGLHPTTQLSLQLLEDYVQPGSSIVDIGCGSGILSIAAAKLGASHILGVDIDPVSVENARQHASLNEVIADFHLGSLEEIRDGALPLKQADVIVANILSPVLHRLVKGGIDQIIAPGGLLILSGILDEQAPDLLNAINNASLEIIAEKNMDGWHAFAAIPQLASEEV